MHLGRLDLLLGQVLPEGHRGLLQVRVLLQLDYLLHDDLLLHCWRPLLQLLELQGQLPQLPLHSQLLTTVLLEAESALVLLHSGPQLLHLPFQLPPPAGLLIQALAQPAVLLMELRVLLGDHHLLHHHPLLGLPPLQQQVLVLQLVDCVLGCPPLLGGLPHLLAQPLGFLLQDGVLLTAHHLLVHRLGLHLGAFTPPLVTLPLQPDELLLGPSTAVDQLIELGLQAVDLPQQLGVLLVPHQLLRHLLVLHGGLLGPQHHQLRQQPFHLLLHAAPLAASLLQLSPEPCDLLLCLRVHPEGLLHTLLQIHPGLLLLHRAVLALQLLQLPGQHLVLTPLRLQEAPQPGRLLEEPGVLFHLLHLLHDHLGLHGADCCLQLHDSSLQLGHGILCPFPLGHSLLNLQPQGLGCLEHLQVLLHLDHFFHHDCLFHIHLLLLKGQQLCLQCLQLGQDGGVLLLQELELNVELGCLAVQAGVPLDLGDLLGQQVRFRGLPLALQLHDLLGQCLQVCLQAGPLLALVLHLGLHPGQVALQLGIPVELHHFLLLQFLHGPLGLQLQQLAPLLLQLALYLGHPLPLLL